MPDITMCQNQSCPVNQKCYRFMAIPSRRQSYAGFTPTSKDGCDRFWAIDSRTVTIDTETNQKPGNDTDREGGE